MQRQLTTNDSNAAVTTMMTTDMSAMSVSFSDEDAFSDQFDRLERPVANNPAPNVPSDTPERLSYLRNENFDI
jgi:hypothetical protein